MINEVNTKATEMPRKIPREGNEKCLYQYYLIHTALKDPKIPT
jgi:hypothetical protein